MANNMRYVGALQDYGVPFSSLYVDMEKRLLYMFVRISSPRDSQNEFAAVNVSPSEVEKFMNVDLGLTDIFSNKPCFLVRIIDGTVYIEDDNSRCIDLIDKSMNLFDPDFCDDDIWLETFIDRIKNNKQLEY